MTLKYRNNGHGGLNLRPSLTQTHHGGPFGFGRDNNQLKIYIPSGGIAIGGHY